MSPDALLPPKWAAPSSLKVNRSSCGPDDWTHDRKAVGSMSASDQLKSDIDELVPDMVALRRDLHEHPELAFEEVRTSGIVAQRLRTMGLEVQTGIAKTGVVGLLRGGQRRPGAKTIAIRADMDALPIHELNEI